MGSDQFAISPQKSANGQVIHFEETHMPWANRFQNYEAHLITPGKLNAGGISWFGSPFFLDGFNDQDHLVGHLEFSPTSLTFMKRRPTPKTRSSTCTKVSGENVAVEYETFKIKGPKGMESHHPSLLLHSPRPDCAG